MEILYEYRTGWTVIKPFKYHIVSDTEIGIVKENWDVLRKMG